jgi:solute:Na+ symporter, SSS family
MTAPTVREAQKGVFAAAAVRILIIPVIVVVPGVVAYKLFGDVGDQAYGRLVGAVLPHWLSGAFAAMMAAAVIAHTSAILNSSVALYSMDFHDQFVAPVKDHWRLAATVSVIFTVTSIALVPLFQNAESIINLLQQLNGLFSMPILSAFISGLLFRNVDARAAIGGVLWGVAFYGIFTFVIQPQAMLPVWLHYIDVMVVTLFSSVAAALLINRFVFGGKAEFRGRAAYE